MTIYEFMNNKDDSIKMVSSSLDIKTIIKAFNAIEVKNDKVSQILISENLFEKLKEEIKKDKFEGDKIYRIITKQNKLFNAQIIINNELPNEIVVFIGSKNNQENKLNLFISN